MARVTSSHPFPRLPGGPSPAGHTTFGIVLALGLLLLASVSGGAVPVGFGAASAGTSAPTSPVSGAAVPATSECATLAADWAARDAPVPAPSVAPAIQSPCVLAHDEAGAYPLSNASGSASHFTVSVALPASNGSSPASAYASFWVGLWVAGVPCSYGGQSYLRVELLPPYTTDDGVAGVPFWTVRAPVWDLVPAGSCDSQCSNDTAFFTIGGRSYCEDDAMLAGLGALNATAEGAFAPGAALSITVNGTVGGPNPLSVAVNDSSDPSESLSWSYSGNRTLVDGALVNATVSGEPITPFYLNATTADTGWTDGLGVGFGWEGCPLPGTGNASGCNSYDGAVTAVAGSPEVDHVASWNATSHTYSHLYPYLLTASSSGACSGNPAAASCTNFRSYGGSGSYPTFAVTAQRGGAWFSYGPAAANDISTFGPLSAEFPANGSLSGLENPTTISDARATATSTDVTITARVTDPNLVKNVTVSTWWCRASNVRETNASPTALVAGGSNTIQDGNWTTVVPTNNWAGFLFYSVVARSFSGVETAPYAGNATVTGSGGSCGATPPPSPGLAPTNISAIGGGYDLSWSEPVNASVADYEVVATPSGSGPVVHFPEPNVTSVRIGGLLANVSYNLQVFAFDPEGLPSNPVPATLAPKTLYPLVALLPTVVVNSAWVNQTGAQFTANSTGGLPPFQMTYSFGDGTSTTVFTTSGDSSFAHLYTDNYSGEARVVVTVLDSAGDEAVSPPVYVDVQATPLATPATISSGDGYAALSWSAPLSPVPVRSYSIFWTTNASWAPYLASAWPNNLTAPEIQLASLPATATRWVLPLPTGTRVYAQIVAVNKYGLGLLPAQTGPGSEPFFEVVVSTFSGGPLTGGLLGAAPFNDSFSATFSTGAGNALASATYHFSGGGIAPAVISGTNGTYFANVSYTFVSPGTYNVYLYAFDALTDEVVLTLTVDVTPGPAPLVSVTVAPTPVFLNTEAGFTANVSGGSGHYTEAWTFGNGENGTGPAVTTVYPNATTYIVLLTVTDSLWGGVTSVSVPVTVLPLPTVQIAATAVSASGAYRLTAVVLGGYGNFTYTWLFDDGTQGTGVTVTHTWAPGRYLVTVEAKDDYGHEANASVAIVVGGNSTGSTAPATGYAPIVVYALLLALVGVALVAVALATRGRRPAEPSSDAESTDLAPLPPRVYEEEGPRGPN
ncbi:MAG: PKD domain-containing protein [Thermoplasmata archaeon]